MTKQRILLGICGGIAAYKSAELVRILRKQAYEVRVVMTQSATEFITPLTFQALSGHSVSTQLLDTEEENAMGHINLARWADIMLIAPATANMIAKLSHGLADDLLSTLYLASNYPVYIAPAMNQAMWHKPVTQDNIARLKKYGVNIIGPTAGEQACGEFGYGRMTEPDDIFNIIHKEDVSTKILKGLKVLVSAGPTREPLDPVRYITNRSSGKMGYALAEAAHIAGADVTIISGPVTLTAPDNINVLRVETAEQMHQAVITRASQYAIYMGAAAVSDYTPVYISEKKIKKKADDSVIQLKKTQDILAHVAALSDRPFVVGFAAETHHLEQYARGKLTQKNVDMIAANWVGKESGGFDRDENALQVYWTDGHKSLAMMSKKELATQLISLIAERVNEKGTA